jgi:hypothetical protein
MIYAAGAARPRVRRKESEVVSSWRKWLSTRVRGGGEHGGADEQSDCGFAGASEDRLRSTFREVVREVAEMSGSQVHVTVTDAKSGHVPVFMQGVMGPPQGFDGGIAFKVGEGDAIELFFSEEVYDEGLAQTGGITARVGGLELVINRLARGGL